MRFIISLIVTLAFFSCKTNENIPDVSDIKIKITTKRFEKDLFTADTNQIVAKMDTLAYLYPSFGSTFFQVILNADPRWGSDTTKQYINGFLSSQKPVFDSAEKIFNDFTLYENQIIKSLQYLRYYFPKYAAPHEIITYIGPLDGYGDILTKDAFVIGLQHHLGKSSSIYNSAWLHETYPQYLTDRFEPDYIVVNCIKNVIDDMYPDKNEEAPFSNQLIEAGKRLYLLQQLIPSFDEYKLIGYSQKQLKDCYTHEAQIWELFIQNNLLHSIDKNLIRNYLGEGPKTQELGEGSPGNIGAFVGWQIVKKYLQKKPKTTPVELMKTDASKILEESKYKP